MWVCRASASLCCRLCFCSYSGVNANYLTCQWNGTTGCASVHLVVAKLFWQPTCVPVVSVLSQSACIQIWVSIIGPGYCLGLVSACHQRSLMTSRNSWSFPSCFSHVKLQNCLLIPSACEYCGYLAVHVQTGAVLAF